MTYGCELTGCPHPNLKSPVGADGPLEGGAERVAGRHLDIGAKVVGVKGRLIPAPEVIIGVTFDEVIPPRFLQDHVSR